MIKLSKILESLNPKLLYTKPNFDFEWEEAVRYPEFKKIGKEKWLKAAEEGYAVKYSKIKDYLGNVDLDFDSLEEPKKARFEKAFNQGRVELPIVVKFNDKDYDLLAGNTRLSGLIKHGLDPTVWVVEA